MRGAIVNDFGDYVISPFSGAGRFGEVDVNNIITQGSNVLNSILGLVGQATAGFKNAGNALAASPDATAANARLVQEANDRAVQAEINSRMAAQLLAQQQAAGQQEDNTLLYVGAGAVGLLALGLVLSRR